MVYSQMQLKNRSHFLELYSFVFTTTHVFTGFQQLIWILIHNHCCCTINIILLTVRQNEFKQSIIF